MVSASTHELEAALRWISLSEESGDFESYCEAAARCEAAVHAVLNDRSLWGLLKKPGPGARSSTLPAESDSDWRILSTLLSDKLAEVMTRVGYHPPPPAIELVKTPRALAKEATAPDLPRSTRDELVGACRTWLVRLHNRLHTLRRPDGNSTAEVEQTVGDTGSDIELASLLRRAKPSLIGMVVVDEIAAMQDAGAGVLRLHAVDASMNLAVRWLSCLEVEPRVGDR